MNQGFPYIFIIIGSAVVILLAYVAYRAFKSNAWPKTDGVLLKKGTRLIESRDSIKNVKDWKSIHIDLEYEYEVNGVKYISTRATFSDMVNKPISSLNKILDDYLSSQHITVHYNPKKPSDSVLFPGLRIWNFTPMIVGVGFIATGFFLLGKV